MQRLHGQVSVHRPELLRIGPHYGGNQLWYPTGWQRQAGCGPTCASHLLWYLSRTRPDCEALYPYEGGDRPGFQRLMEDVWHYVTPGRMGVNRTDILTDGVVRYGAQRGVALRCRVLDISPVPAKRPPLETLLAFLAQAFTDDLPVAFLNLSNGALRNLDNWHWVTLTGLDADSGAATMYDQGARSVIDLDLWLRTTALGGGFAAAGPES